MRANIYWAILVIFTALIEATWLGLIQIGDVLPNMVLLITVYFGITYGEERAMFTGALGGIIQDVAADTALGHHALALIIVGYTVGRLSERLVTESPAVKAMMVLAACLVHGFIYITVDYVQNPGMNAVDAVLVSMIPRTFYTILVTPVVFYALFKVLPHSLSNTRSVA